VAGRFADRHPAIRSIRLPAKGGIDHDYDQAVQQARGAYCWLLSDDDRVKPGAIEAVLKSLEDQPEVVIVNAEVRERDWSRQIVPRLLDLADDRRYPPEAFERFFIDNVVYMSFLGCVVIRRETWLERERAQYYGSEFVHLGVIFQAPPQRECVVLAFPWISIRYGNASWSARSFEIWMVKWPRLLWSFECLSPAARRQLSDPEPWRNPRALLIQRAKGYYSTREYQQWVRPRLPAGWRRWMMRLIAVLPGRVVNALVLAFWNLRRPGDRFTLRELRDSRFYWRRGQARGVRAER
jgi:hypothetical protein